MKFLKRTLVLVSATMVAAATMAGTGGAATTNYQSYKAQGIVESNDITPATPVKEGFRIASPYDDFGNNGIRHAQNDDGSLDVRPQPTTKYYRFEVTKGRYVQSTYDETILVGYEIRVSGKYGKVGEEYEVLANTVYLPPKTLTPPPPNPVCATPKDFTFGRVFSVQGDVMQTGYSITGMGIYSDFFGFVVGNLAKTNNAHIAAVAAHDHGKLGVNVIATGEQNTVTGYPVPFTTRYRKQNPTTLRWSESTKDETVIPGNLIQTAGRYGCELNDWRQLATFVFNPVRGASTGNVMFNEVTRRTEDGTSGTGSQEDTAYDGTIVTGDETVDAGAPFALDNVDWVFNPTTSEWDFDGEWAYANAQGFGTILGEFGGTWNPSTGAVTGTALMTGGTGRYSDKVGTGTISGSALAPIGGSGAPTTFDGAWIINVM